MFPVTTLCPRTGDGCSPLQLQCLQGLWQLNSYFEKRAVRPRIRWGLYGARRPLSPAEPLQRLANVAVVILFDTIERREAGANAYNDLVPQAWVYKLGFDALHRLTTHSPIEGNMEYLPMAGFQPSRRILVENCQLCNWCREGMLRLRRLGDFIDVCVGELPNGEPAVLYRIQAHYFHGKTPAISMVAPELLVRNGHLILESGETQECTTVGAGEPLVNVYEIAPPPGLPQLPELERVISIQQCSVDRQRPVYREARLPIYPLSHPAVPTIAALNLDLMKTACEQADALPAPRVLLAYTRESLLRLPYEPQFAATGPELLRDLTQRLRTQSLDFTSRVNGKVKSVETESEVVRITYDSGATQLVPASATLLVHPVDQPPSWSESASEVFRHQPIARLAANDTVKDWPQLQAQFGRLLPDLLAEFLLGQAESVSGSVDEYLLPQAYVRGAESLAIEGKQNPRCYVDLSPVMSYFDETNHSVVMPAVTRPREPQVAWGELQLVLGQFNTWSHSQTPGQEAGQSRRPKHWRRRAEARHRG